MRTKILILVTSAFLLTSCTPVKETARITQPLNTQLTAGVGDTLLSIAKEKNLPNAFGASDIFGRKTPTGLTTVEYLGVRKGKAIFKRKSILIETGATTMNSTPLVIQNTQTSTHSGIVGGTMYHGNSVTSGPSTVIPANTPQTQFLDQGTVEITVDLRKHDKALVVEGKTIIIENADSTKVIYTISE